MVARNKAVMAAVVLAAAFTVGCQEETSTVQRSTRPAVLTGADLPGLTGAAPDAIVAFKHHRVDGEARWTQVPVQVDERAVVPFGTQPVDNTTPGVDGTVYGSGYSAQSSLQYTDNDTFVGADPDPTFDADDELVFMVSDAGSRPGGDVPAEPVGVLPGSGVAVEVHDPRDPDAEGWIHLFVSDGTLDPAAGRDYVDYDFELTSGDYRSTYKRAAGPNPETSSVTTDSYRISFPDRWFDVAWQVGDGPPLLEGTKNTFPGTCGRSNTTFAAGEGAFVANIDGPVRAIRSYVGANSGPKTQRTHLMYRHHVEIQTDLRVHAIPGILDLLDWNENAVGMTYRSSTTPAGVTIDGSPDVVGSALPTWEAVHGEAGTIVSTSRIHSDVPGIEHTWNYRDERTGGVVHCWGDQAALGVSGSLTTGPGGGTLATTDPVDANHRTLRGVREAHFLPGTTDGDVVNAVASELAEQTDAPLTFTVSPHLGGDA